MKREIKFRAFNKSKKQMFLSPDDIRHIGSWFDAHLPGSLSKVKNISIMQYIGLKDKNDIEIFEDDIVKTNYGWIGKVYFSTPTFGVITDKGVCNDFDWEDFEKFEVIGNIHENPKLLTPTR